MSDEAWSEAIDRELRFFIFERNHAVHRLGQRSHCMVAKSKRRTQKGAYSFGDRGRLYFG